MKGLQLLPRNALWRMVIGRTMASNAVLATQIDNFYNALELKMHRTSCNMQMVTEFIEQGYGGGAPPGDGDTIDLIIQFSV